MELFDNFGLYPERFIGQLCVWVILFFVLKKWAFGPILKVLDERKRMIEQSVANSERISKELEEAEKTRKEMLSKAHQEVTAMLEEAKASAGKVEEQKIQAAVAQAEQILKKAEQAAEQNREQLMAELKGEIGRMVVLTTEKVIGRSVTAEDQKRLQEEALAEVR